MSNVLIEIGPITIYWYSFLILIAIILGVTIAQREALNRNISQSLLLDLTFGMVICGIIGARLYYVIFNFAYFKDNILEIFRIWNGGLAIYGAIFGGIIYVVYYSLKNDLPIDDVFDVLAPSLILGQAIGRWGNFFNQEAYGVATSLEVLEKMHIPEFIINNMYIDGVYYTPMFWFESIWCLLGFGVLMVLRRGQRRKPGYQVATYAIWYGVGRYFIEGFRTDSLYFMNFKVSQVVSLFFILLGIVIFIRGWLRVKKARNEEGNRVNL